MLDTAQRAARFPHFLFLQFPPKHTTFLISADVSHSSSLLQPATKTALDAQQVSPVVQHLCRKTLWLSPFGSSIFNHHGPFHMELNALQTQMIYLGGDNNGCGAGSRQPREWTEGPAATQSLAFRSVAPWTIWGSLIRSEKSTNGYGNGCFGKEWRRWGKE